MVEMFGRDVWRDDECGLVWSQKGKERSLGMGMVLARCGSELEMTERRFGGKHRDLGVDFGVVRYLGKC